MDYGSNITSTESPPFDPFGPHIRSGRAKISGTESTPDEVTIHYLQALPRNSGPIPPKQGTILLIHGFPETSYQFRHVIRLLASKGYHVVAPDYRGAGASSHPTTVPYTKTALASDLRTLLREHLKISEPIHVVGHDIGGMIAHAFAASFPQDVASVTWGECPLPGSKAYEQTKHDPGLWHFTFHWQPDLPEFLVQGRERRYIKHFYDRLCFNANFLTSHDLDVYEDAFAQPGAMRAGFETYRAFHDDARENKEILKKQGKSRVPAMALNGEHSLLAPLAQGMFEEFYEGFEVSVVRESGHWCAEENPEGFVEKVVQWVRRHSRKG